MDGYCLRTKLVEKPSVCLYYKGMEGNEAIPEALNAVVAFSPTDALELDEDAAERLCKRLNEDGASLLGCGYTEFEIIPLDVGNIKDNV